MNGPRKISVAAVSILFAAITFATAQVSVPHLIKLQGHLSDKSSGTAVPADGIFGMQFVVCDALTDGTCGSSVTLSVTVSNGLYEVGLPFPPSAFDGADRFIEITIGGQVLTPRIRLASAPFAYTAARIDGFEGSDLDQSGDVTANSAAIAANAAAISSNAAGVGANTMAIGNNATGVTANVTAINNNTIGVAANQSNIGLNTAAIADKVSNAGDTITGMLVLSPAAGDALVITNGNVGIGTQSPSSLLEVAGTLTTGVLVITGGADIAEPFPVSDPVPLAAGTVVIIDPDAPGRLRRSVRAFDTRVAGIVSGAGDVNPGLTLSQEAALGNGPNVALTGRVYALATATNGPIRPGDLLTTSDLPGHAMKATDFTRAQGAGLGKAMTGLEDGTGLVLVLVSLQ